MRGVQLVSQHERLKMYQYFTTVKLIVCNVLAWFGKFNFTVFFCIECDRRLLKQFARNAAKKKYLLLVTLFEKTSELFVSEPISSSGGQTFLL
jgi:hypothetical protein